MSNSLSTAKHIIAHGVLRVRQRFETTTASAYQFLNNINRRAIYLTVGLLLLLAGAALSIWVLVPVEQSLFPDSTNSGTISSFQNNAAPNKSVNYVVTLLPVRDTEDVLVVIDTNLERSSSTKYEVAWPGQVELHPRGTVEAVSKIDSSEVLAVRVDWEGYGQTRLIAEGLDDPYYNRRDSFIFYWVGGKERISFADRRIRIRLVPVDGDISLDVSLVGSQQLIQDSPPSSSVEPSVLYGGTIYAHTKQDAIIFTYTELGLRNLSQFILLLSGIFIGIATNLLSQPFVDYVEEWRNHSPV